MYVTQMTDQQLHQASEFFTEGSRAQAIRLQIDKRAQVAQATLAAKAEAAQAEALASVRAVKPAGQERYGERLDNVITDEDQIGQGGLMEKYRDNVRAIQLVRTLDAENRNAKADELRVLARYVGWGGFASMLFSGFPGLVQLGLYSIVGLVTAALVTRYVLPHLRGAEVATRDLSRVGAWLTVNRSRRRLTCV